MTERWDKPKLRYAIRVALPCTQHLCKSNGEIALFSTRERALALCKGKVKRYKTYVDAWYVMPFHGNGSVNEDARRAYENADAGGVIVWPELEG